MTRFETEKCAFPYFVAEDVKDVYVNVAAMGKITEEEATILDRVTYNKHLEHFKNLFLILWTTLWLVPRGSLIFS